MFCELIVWCHLKQDDDDWEVKAEKEDLVLQKDISLRPSYAGSDPVRCSGRVS
jgi:hypothetical protein